MIFTTEINKRIGVVSTGLVYGKVRISIRSGGYYVAVAVTTWQPADSGLRNRRRRVQNQIQWYLVSGGTGDDVTK